MHITYEHPPEYFKLFLDYYIIKLLYYLIQCKWASQMALVIKNALANAGDLRDVGLTPG